MDSLQTEHRHPDSPALPELAGFDACDLCPQGMIASTVARAACSPVKEPLNDALSFDYWPYVAQCQCG